MITCQVCGNLFASDKPRHTCSKECLSRRQAINGRVGTDRQRSNRVNAEPHRRCVSCLLRSGVGPVVASKRVGVRKSVGFNAAKQLGLHGSFNAKRRMRQRADAINSTRNRINQNRSTLLSSAWFVSAVGNIPEFAALVWLAVREAKYLQRVRYKQPKALVNKKYRDRYHSDHEFRLKERLRRRLRKLTGGGLKRTARILVGCTWLEFREHIESQFRSGMSWDNCGQWHIDHIIPCRCFDLSKESEQLQCFHFTNLIPIWADDNLRKGGRFDGAIQYQLINHGS